MKIRFTKILLLILFMCTVMTEIMAGTLLLWKKQQDTEEQRLYQNLEKMVTKKKVRDLKAGQLDQLPDLDESALRKQNSEYVAWLFVPDTVISYPVVYPENNRKYLTVGVDQTGHSYGCLFFDASAEPFSTMNTVIHGHNMRSGDMFGSLKNYLEQDYADQHTELYLLIDGIWNRYELLSAYKMNQLDVFPYQNVFSNKLDLRCYMNQIKAESMVDTQAEIPTNIGELLTLSTCHGEKEKMIVQWVKKQE